MSDAATGQGSSGTQPKVSSKDTSERRRYDLTGSIPQWITSALLAIIGCLIIMVWNSMDRRVTDMEKKIESVVAMQDAKAIVAATDIASLKVHSTITDQIVAELRAGQSQTSNLVTQAITELRFLSNQLSKPK